MLSISHNCGFFSCCSVKIYKIINYFSKNKTLPNIVDSSRLFGMYKKDDKVDITPDFFLHPDSISKTITYSKKIPITKWGFQVNNYKSVDYDSIVPFVNKYFAPSPRIINIYNKLITKYNINPDNCIGLYYRGTDKRNETKLDSFENYYIKLLELVAQLKNTQILIQTDTTQFIEFMKDKPLKNVIIIDENSTSSSKRGIHNEMTKKQNYIDIQTLFATFLIISRCKYIICSSGNCSIWIMYYRNNAHNVYQNLNRKWL